MYIGVLDEIQNSVILSDILTLKRASRRKAIDWFSHTVASLLGGTVVSIFCFPTVPPSLLDASTACMPNEISEQHDSYGNKLRADYLLLTQNTFEVSISIIFLDIADRYFRKNVEDSN